MLPSPRRSASDRSLADGKQHVQLILRRRHDVRRQTRGHPATFAGDQPKLQLRPGEQNRFFPKVYQSPDVIGRSPFRSRPERASSHTESFGGDRSLNVRNSARSSENSTKSPVPAAASSSSIAQKRVRICAGTENKQEQAAPSSDGVLRRQARRVRRRAARASRRPRPRAADPIHEPLHWKFGAIANDGFTSLALIRSSLSSATSKVAFLCRRQDSVSVVAKSPFSKYLLPGGPPPQNGK